MTLITFFSSSDFLLLSESFQCHLHSFRSPTIILQFRTPRSSEYSFTTTIRLFLGRTLILENRINLTKSYQIIPLVSILHYRPPIPQSRSSKYSFTTSTQQGDLFHSDFRLTQLPHPYYASSHECSVVWIFMNPLIVTFFNIPPAVLGRRSYATGLSSHP